MSNPEIAYETPMPRLRLPSWRRLQMGLAERVARWALRVYRRADDSNLMSHAARELRVAGMSDPDAPYGGLLSSEMLDLMTVFTMAGHSGGSAALASGIFEKISRFEPLTPLTGADDEWMEVADGMFQNKRCSHVFKDAERGAYDIDGKVFEEPNGVRFTSAASRVPVTFPYWPTTVVVNVPASGETV